jgi:hypothetical protein
LPQRDIVRCIGTPDHTEASACRRTKLDPYIDLVNQRWNEGMINAEASRSSATATGG